MWRWKVDKQARMPHVTYRLLHVNSKECNKFAIVLLFHWIITSLNYGFSYTRERSFTCFVEKKLLFKKITRIENEIHFKAKFTRFEECSCSRENNFQMDFDDIWFFFFLEKLFNCSNWMLNGNLFLMTTKTTDNSIHNGNMCVYHKRIYQRTEIYTQTYNNWLCHRPWAKDR